MLIFVSVVFKFKIRFKHLRLFKLSYLLKAKEKLQNIGVGFFPPAGLKGINSSPEDMTFSLTVSD